MPTVTVLRREDSLEGRARLAPADVLQIVARAVNCPVAVRSIARRFDGACRGQRRAGRRITRQIRHSTFRAKTESKFNGKRKRECSCIAFNGQNGTNK